MNLLRNEIRDVELNIQQGLTCISWLSSSIQKYCNNCNLKINYLDTVYNQIHHIEKDILEKKIDQLINYNFFDYETEDPLSVLNCKDYFHQVEQTRIKLIDEMKYIYESIGGHLIKIETLVLKTNTGKSPLMKLTYQHWEHQIYKGLTNFVLRNLENFLAKLKSTTTKLPVFRIDTILIKPDIYLSPTITEIFNVIIKNIRDFLNCLKAFMRWMDGTCLLCPHYTNYSFYNDIISNSDINELIRKIQEITQFSILNVQKYLQKFRRYRSLWVFDKLATCQKFLERYQDDLSKFDERFVFYSNIINDLDHINNYIDVGCIRLNLQPLLGKIKQHTIEWKTILGNLLDKIIKELMSNMKVMIDDLVKKLNHPIKDFEDFKLVMETIKAISTNNVIAELKYKNFQQSYLLLKQHELNYNLENERCSILLGKQWNALLLSSIDRYMKLKPIRDKYCNITLNEIDKFLLILKEFIKQYDDEGPGGVSDLNEGLLLLDYYRNEFEQYEQQRQEFIKLEYLFHLPTVNYENYLNRKNNYDALVILYKFYQKFQQSKEIWGCTLWSDLNTDELLHNIEIFIDDFNKISNKIRELPTGVRIYEKLDQFKQTIPLMLMLKSPAMRERHWFDLMKLTTIEFDLNVFHLNSLFEMDLYQYDNEINVILRYAVNESIIEENLGKIIEKWTNLDFVLKKYKNYLILDLIEDYLQILEDDLVSLHNMSTSIYVRPFYEQIKLWQQLLVNVNQIIDQLLLVQKKWISLENCFTDSDDLEQRLPEEFALFKLVNQQFGKIIDEIHANPNILKYSKRLDIFNELQNIQQQFDKCRKSLNQYLDVKRQQSPRLYFLSDDELLIMISNSENFRILQPYIIKLFNNIKSLRINNDTKMITAMVSYEDEILEFVNPIEFTKRFEDWLNDIVREMLKTVRYIIKRTIFNYGKFYYKSRTEYLTKYQTLICLTNNLIWWTLEVEYVFKHRDKMNNYLKQLNQQLEDILKLFNKSSTNQHILKLRQILIADLHQRDITENLFLSNPQNTNDFEWTRQLRFYWLNNVDNLVIKQLNAQFDYGYEFMGLNNCFITTPMTDRIYLTITQALMLNFNCLLYGRISYGKNETIKNLATTFGILCLIINCCNNFNSIIITRYLNGLIQCGIWGCFKQFNHINIDTLSIITTQLQTIRDAALAKFDKFHFEGNEILLNHKFGIFLTLNNNYKLLETVKQLCRPIVCTKPDSEQICSIQLYSYGLKEWRILAKKLISFHQLAGSLLTKQQHYDWSLTSVNSVLIQMDKLINERTIQDESTILIKSLIDVNLPKLIDDDLPIFYNLIQDVFPDVDYEDLPKSIDLEDDIIETILIDDGYTVLTKQIEKIQQLHELLTIKDSLMLIGPSGGGKSVIINTLIKIRIQQNLIIKKYFVNPKALTVDDLYGCYDGISNNWIDGLVANLLHQLLKLDNFNECFIIFDGDIDLLLLEQLTTLISDDNQKFLTLINGERLYLNKTIYFLYETGDLTHTTPAIITKITMIYVDSNLFDYQSYWNCWINTKIVNLQCRQVLMALYEQFITPLFNADDVSLKTFIPLNYLDLIKQLCYILDAIGVDNDTIDNNLLLPVFIDSLYNSIGMLLIDEDSREQFDEFIKKQSQLNNFDDTIENRCDYSQLPTNFATLFDYYFDITEKNWVAYDWILLHDSYEKLKFSQIFVPTRNTIRIERLLKLLVIDSKRPVCLIGEKASAKTAIVENFFKSLKQFEEYLLVNINFSRSTTSKHVEKQLEVNLVKLTKIIYGPRDDKKLICFIDDLNTPKFDDNGTQQPIAFLKLLFQYNGFYETTNYNWREIENIKYITAIDQQQQQIDRRLLSMLTIINVNPPDTTTLYFIYQRILDGFLSKFQPELQIADKLIEMTLNVYGFVQEQLPPTPNRFFYIFNLRDLSRIISGLYQIQPEYFTTIEQIVRVWRNEITRVFCDSMYDKDRDLVCGEIRNQIEFMFKRDIENIDFDYDENENDDNMYDNIENNDDIDNMESNDNIENNDNNDNIDNNDENDIIDVEEFIDYNDIIREYSLRDPLLFGDYRNALTQSSRRYEDLLAYDAIYFLIEEILDEYNHKNDQHLNIILFNDLLEYLTRIHRCIRLHNGHVLIIGDGCCGKTLLTRLVTFTANYQLFMLIVDGNLNEDRFKDELKRLFQQCGLEQKPTVFYCKPFNEKFIEYIDNIVKFGKVPLLFSETDRKSIIDQYRGQYNCDTATNDGEIWTIFLDKCRENLHVIVSIAFGDCCKLRPFPNLINCTTINLITKWPKEGLYDIATFYLKDNSLLPADLRDSIIDHVVYIHGYVDNHYSNYITSKHYLDLIQTYLKVLEDKNCLIDAYYQRLNSGLTKIDAISEELENFNAFLKKQQIILKKSIEDCELMLIQIEENKRAAEEKKLLASEKTIEIEEKIELINLEQIEAEKILALALPKLELARLALNDLNKLDITEIRSFPTPPEPVKILVECIALLFGYEEVNWKVAKGMMADPTFLKQLQEIDCNLITIQQQRTVKAHLKQTKQLDKMKQISKAADNLLKYLFAILEYCEVLRDVKPKQLRVEQLQNELNLIKQYLERLNMEILRIEQQIILLNKQYQESIEKREMLQRQIDMMLKRFEIANKLLTGLKNDRQHWMEEVQELELQRHNSIGDCLVIASFLNYSGPFDSINRDKMLNNYQNDILERQIPLDESFKLKVQFFGEVDKNLMDLDDLSQQNCILLMKSLKSPLCIDPQEQAFKLICTIEKSNDLQILNYNDSNFSTILERALITGLPVLIDDIDDYIDPIIYDIIIRRNIYIVNNKLMILFNDKQLELNRNFRLYLTTKLKNPQFNLTIYTYCTVINYTINVNCLDEQILNIVVRNERPDIGQQYDELLNEIANNNMLLDKSKDLLIAKLTAIPGNLMDNLESIDVLEEIKSQINEITSKLQSNEETLLNIQHFRNNYRSISRIGATIFFILLDLSKVHRIYQYSLLRYLELFKNSMKKTLPFIILSKRLANIKITLIKCIYEYGCVSISQQHQPLFAFLLAIKIQLDCNQLKQSQIDFLVYGSRDDDGDDNDDDEEEEEDYVNIDGDFPEFLTQQCWNNIRKLSRDFPETFSNLVDDIRNNLHEWQQWYESDKPELLLPNDYRENLKPFDILMLLRCFRTDRLYSVANNFIQQTIGDEFIEPPSVSLDNIYKQSTCDVPILFILNSFQNPLDDLKKLSLNYERKFDYLSLGSTRQILTMNLLEDAINNGYWLLLQNIHLLPHFMKTIDWKMKQFDEPHSDFRLWLTTEFVVNLPVGLLQNSLKIVLEPSNNFRLNLRNTYARLDEEIFETCQHVSFRKLLYVLVFFNGVVQLRRKYNKIGWNIYYDFNQIDFDVSVKLLEQNLSEHLQHSHNNTSSSIPWNCLKYLIGDVVYGGHVFDEYDRRIIETYINEYMGDFLFSEFQPFHFYFDTNLDYFIPPDGSKDDYIGFINELPANNGPEVYGLHSNADIEYYTQITKEMWQLLKELHPQAPTNEGETDRYDSIKTIADEILMQLPLQYDICTIREFYQNTMTPTIVVLLQELYYFNTLIEIMQQTLKKLLKALNGRIVMDTDLDDMAQCLFNGQLPNVWRKNAPDTCKYLGDWLQHLQKRQEQYQAWTNNGEPLVLWISGLHYPEAYLKALVQLACQLYEWPVDQSTYYVSVTKFLDPEEVTLKPSEGNCMFYGLYLNGASWDLINQCLRQSPPKVIIERMPVISVVPIENFRLKLQNTLKTPVYTTTQRCSIYGGGLSFELNLNTKKHVSHWILQGVCLILNTDSNDY